MRIKPTLDKSFGPISYHPIVLQASEVRKALDKNLRSFKRGNSDNLRIMLFLSTCVFVFFRWKYALTFE